MYSFLFIDWVFITKLSLLLSSLRLINILFRGILINIFESNDLLFFDKVGAL